jgi:uncharacterized protein
MRNLVYLLIGFFFGIVLIQSEIASWFRIQEMFRFQSFHMYGIMGSAIMVAASGNFLMKRLKAKSLSGTAIGLPPKRYHHGLIIGGLIFGIGWGLAGACPGPVYALVGKGILVMIVFLISGLVGTWIYSYYRERLPH